MEEAVQELKETQFKDLFKEEVEDRTYVRDVQIETDIEMLIPDQYINNIQERLNLYTELYNIEHAVDLEKFHDKMIDRFGPVPPPVKRLFEALEIRWICKKLGFERCILKRETLRCFFVLNPQSSFYETEFFQRFLTFLGNEGKSLQLNLRQSKQYLIMSVANITSLEKAQQLLSEIEEKLNVQTVENE